MVTPPILDNKHACIPSVFAPAALLREARRQKGLDTVNVPPVCILDPDGDLVRQLRQTGKARPFTGWPCYHTELDTFDLGRPSGRNSRPSCWCVFRRPRGRRAFRQRLQAAREPHVGRSDYPRRVASVRQETTSRKAKRTARTMPWPHWIR